MTRAAGRATALLLVALLALPGGAAPAGAAAGARAALVVEVGQTVRRLCVRLGAATVSGKELVEATGLEQRWHGGALCRLAGTGPAGGDCFAQYPKFWGYWIGDGGGGWTWSEGGAATTTVRDGSVQAWVWGSGADGSTHPEPARLAFAGVCAAGGAADGATAVGEGAGASTQRQAGRGATTGSGTGGAGVLATAAGGGAALLAALALLWLAWRRRHRA